MTTPTPKETALACLRADRDVSAQWGSQDDGVVERLDAAIAWVEGLQAESDERAFRAWMMALEWYTDLEQCERAPAEAEARRLLAEGKLGT